MKPGKRKFGTVAGPHPKTAAAGMAMLKAGGNAVDAAVAAAFTEGVVEPRHNGVAGYGGCMLVYDSATRKTVAIDYNSTAPAAASERMFAIEKADSPAGYRVRGRANILGPLSVGVPGVVAGLCLALRRFGTMPLNAVMAPAIRAARFGFVPNKVTRVGLIEEAVRWGREFPETARVFLNKSGRVPRAGERTTNRDLARTLEMIAAAGPAVFYRGEVGKTIADHIQQLGGCLTTADLRAYRARLVSPSQTPYRDCQVYTPPVGAGGLTTLQMLRLIEGYDVAGLSVVERFHLCIEAMKVCWPERLRRFGDADFVDFDNATELSDDLASRLGRRLRRGLKSPKPGKVVAHEPFSCTSHISTADGAGNMVSLTQTHGGAFGSMVTVPGTGLLLGHGVGRFDPRPGLANSIAPGKRPLHNMSPVIVTRDGRPFTSFGIPGGRTIVNNQLTLSIGLIDLGKSAQQVLAGPRLHCEGGEPVCVERRAGKRVLDGLRQLGHTLEVESGIGGPGHAIVVEDDVAVQSGATDPRFEGCVAAS